MKLFKERLLFKNTVHSPQCVNEQTVAPCVYRNENFKLEIGPTENSEKTDPGGSDQQFMQI